MFRVGSGYTAAIRLVGGPTALVRRSGRAAIRIAKAIMLPQSSRKFRQMPQFAEMYS